MSFGLRTFLEDGSVQIDTTTFSYRLLLSTLVDFSTSTSNQTRTFPVPGVTTANAYAILLPLTAYSSNNRQAEAVITNGVVSVRNFLSGSTIRSRETMRLIVIGFR